jgi:hypothetical protein
VRIQFREVEFPGKQEDHGANRSNPAVASRLTFGGLEQTIESFQEAIGLACPCPSDYPLDMVAEHAGSLLHGLDLGMHDVGAPLSDGSSLGILVAHSKFNHSLSNTYRYITVKIRYFYMSTVL